MARRAYDPVERLAEIFAETGVAHHEAFRGTKGDDPDWPQWYADYLGDDLRDLTGEDLTRDEIIDLLEFAEEARVKDGAGDRWPTFYARWIVDELA